MQTAKMLVQLELKNRLDTMFDISNQSGKCNQQF